MTEAAQDALSTLQDAHDDFAQAMRSCQAVPGDALGLDYRCYGLHVIDDMIIVGKGHDRTLQYYGGFEYVEDNARQEFGDWVIYYSSECERVNDAIEYYNDVGKENIAGA